MPTLTILNPGEVLGGFRVVEVIGMGGMATVYRAEQVSLGRPAALKVLSRELTSDASFRERFRREGKHAAALEHPNIVPVYDYGEARGHLYLAMRLVDGTNLAERIQACGLSADQTIEVLGPIASALDHAHAAELIHRDVKPQNILIATNGHVYLADFGIAKAAGMRGLTDTGGFVGSINFASPEQINNQTLSPASDIYALTAVLFQCLTGRVPYPRDSDAGVMRAHLNEPPPKLPADADADFHAVLARGMAKDPADRYQRAGDLLDAAASCVRQLATGKREAVPAFPPPDEPNVERTAVSAPPPVLRAPDTVLGANSGPDLTRVGQPEPPETFERAAESFLAGTREPTVHTRRDSAWKRWRGHPVMAASVVVALAATTVAVVLALGGSRGTNASAFRSGSLALAPGRGWKTTSPSIPGLAIDGRISIARGSTQVLAGVIAHQVPVAGGVPTSLVSAYGRADSTSVVQLPLGPAKRYTWSGPRLAPLIVFVIATSKGELAIACGAGSASLTAQATTECGLVASSARVLGATVEYPGADPAIVRQVAAELEARDTVLASTRSGLTSTPAERASALRAIAAVDAKVAGALAGIAGTSRYGHPLATLAAALRAEGALAERAAHAAREGRRGAYEAARRDAGSASSQLVQASRALAAVGLSGLPALSGLQIATLSTPATSSTSNHGSGNTAPTTTSETSSSSGSGSTSSHSTTRSTSKSQGREPGPINEETHEHPLSEEG